MSGASSLPPLFGNPILFFGGKGGVGKTTVAAAFAVGFAERGQRTLLVSTDPAHSTSDILEVELGPDPRPVCENCWAMEVDPGVEADRYIADVKQRIGHSVAPRLSQEVERQIDAARVSPGAEEAALFDRFTRIIDAAASAYDRVLFDTAPTGQTLRLVSLPELMTTWITGLVGQRKKVNALNRMWRNVAGAAAGGEPPSDTVLAALEERRDRYQRARSVLTDANITGFLFVIIPERLPILETKRAVEVLVKHGIKVGGVIVNMVLPEGVEGVFWERRRAREADYLSAISAEFRGYPLLRVPLFDRDMVGVSAMRRVLQELECQQAS